MRAIGGLPPPILKPGKFFEYFCKKWHKYLTWIATGWYNIRKRGIFGMVEIGDDDVVAIATAVVNAYFGDEAELRADLIGESVAGVLKACASFDGGRGCSFLTYAYKCAKNEVAMFMRRERKWRRLLSDKDVDFEEIVGVEDRDVMRESFPFDNIERLRVVKERFKSEDERRIVDELLSGKKQAVVARDFGINRGKVSYVYSKVKKMVNEMFVYEDGEVLERWRALIVIYGICCGLRAMNTKWHTKRLRTGLGLASMLCFGGCMGLAR